MLGEALFSVLGRKWVSRGSALKFFSGSLGIGVIALTFALLYLSGDSGGGSGIFKKLVFLQWPGLLAILWIGPLGTTAAYLIWLNALKNAPIATLALTLFLQPLAGVLWVVFL